MNARVASVLAAVAVGLAAPRAAAQTAVVAAPGGVTRFGLEGADGADPFAPSAAGATDLITGAVTPVPVPSVAVIGNIGFSYLRPFWPSGGQELRLAGANNPAVAVIRPTADLSRSFGFVPRVDLTYALNDAIEVGASAQYVGLGGNLDRTVTLPGGAADLVASSDLSILVVTPVEINKPFAMADLTDHPLVEHLGRADDTFVSSIGLRYTAIRQDFHASLRGNGAQAAADATQTFNGLGLTAGLTGDHPVAVHWGFYTLNRCTLLLGQNTRKSSSSGTDVGGPFSTSLSENKTTFFPAVETEVGVRYMAPLYLRPLPGQPNPRLTLRVGFTGQYYSEVGFLPATPGAAEFDNRALYLAGFTVLAGLEY